MDDLKNDVLISELKDASQCIAFYATLLGKGVDEIGRAISLSEWYSRAIRVAQSEFLAEIIERPADDGIAAAKAELKRQAAEKRALEEERSRLHAETDKERSRLSKAAHDHKTAAATLDAKGTELAEREKQLAARESRVVQVEDVEAGKRSVTQERLAVQELLAAEKERLQSAAAAEFERRINEEKSQQDERTAQIQKREANVAAEEKRLADARASQSRSKRRAFALQLAVFCVLASAAFLPVRERIIEPFLDAKSEADQAKAELADSAQQLAEMRDSLRDASNELMRRAAAEQQREAQLGAASAELERREQALAAAQSSEQERASSLNDQEARLGRRSRDAQALQAQLDQRAASLASKEEQLRAQAADIARKDQAISAREQAVAAQSPAMAGTQRYAAPAVGPLAPVQVQVGSDARDVVQMSGNLGIVPLTLNGPGTCSFGIRPGRHSYTITVRSRLPGPYGWRFVDWSGSGVVDVPAGGASFLVRGVYPRLWLERR